MQTITSTLRHKSYSRGLAALLLGASLAAPALAADYKIDPGHSFISFRIQHLGYSWMIGTFNDLSGEFSYDANDPESAKISVEVNTASVDTNHAERDKHLRSADFLEVDAFPKASFVSTKYTGGADEGTLEGNLTVHGVTLPVSFKVNKIGEGKDPWGGYRAGFAGQLELTRKDYNVSYNLGPKSETMTLELFVEGIRK